MNRFSLLVVMLGVGACGPDAGTMMSDYAQNIGRHVDELQVEQTAHSSEMASLATLDRMQDTELSHWQRIDDHLGRMNLLMSDMMICGNERGTRIDTAGFAGSMQKVRLECDAHRKALQWVTDLATARGEEVRHQDAVHDTMIVMKDQWNTMMLDSRGYTCSHCRHCGM